MDNIWLSIIYLVIGLVIGAAIGWFYAKHTFEKQVRENPPINEKMIRTMYAQMGRKPSEAQIRAIMKSMKQ